MTGPAVDAFHRILKEHNYSHIFEFRNGCCGRPGIEASTSFRRPSDRVLGKAAVTVVEIRKSNPSPHPTQMGTGLQDGEAR